MAGDRSDSQSVLVTGSSSGFGEVIVKTLAGAGYHVYATMRDPQSRNAEVASALTALAAAEGLTLKVVEMDVADDDSVNRAVEGILRNEQIDVVVNNAGIAASGPLEAFSSAQIQELFNINAFGPLRVNRAVLPQMRARGSGLLIHVSSTLGRILPGGGGLYPASKWALEGLIESQHYQVAPFGIDVVLLEPGSFPTPATSKGLRAANQQVTAEYAERAPPNRRAEATPDYVPPDIQEVADAVKYLIELPQGKRPLRYVVGPVFTTGVDEYNQTYEAHKQRLAEALRRPDQATPWTRARDIRPSQSP
ncbi:MAG TPA: SDR family oxidoreductase [Dehalococcoidia bacterium]|nr:SDR family oxidoreductase [Dehalococcoidia bacterium]